MIRQTTSEAAHDVISRRARRLWLAVIVVAGLALRIFRLSWGLPGYEVPDSWDYFIDPAMRLAGAGEFIPRAFIHPPVLPYALGLVYLGWSLIAGQPISVGSPQLLSLSATLSLVGRGFGAVLATLSIAVLYLLARRLVGTRAALLAAAAFALSPIHVLETHRVNPDGPMILLMLLAAHRAVRGAERRNGRELLVAFALAGLAGATKYSGLSSVTVPAWIALRWERVPWKRSLQLCVAGACAALGGFGLGMIPAAFDLQALVKALQVLTFWGYLGGHLFIMGTVPYVSPLLVLLPYVMGWPIYLTGLGGLFVLARVDRRAFQIVLAAIVPYFLVQGVSPLMIARYYLPFAPYLALAAGVALDQLWLARPRLGLVLATVVLGYSALLTGSHVARLGLGPQRAVAALVAERAQAASASGRTLVVAYPDPTSFKNDTIRPMLMLPGVKVIHVSGADRRSGRDAEGLREEELVERDRQWIAERDVEVIVLPTRVPQADRFYLHLADGRLGFRLVAYFRTHFLTERLYVWADPTLDSYSAAGIAAYKVFVRDEK